MMEFERGKVLGNLSQVNATEAFFAKCICICAGQSTVKSGEEIERLYA